jgi:hypothetical protein
MDRWRVSISALSAAASAGYLFYWLLASVPVPQALTLVPATEAGPPSAVGKAMATDTPTVVDRLRPSDEDIAKALRRAIENWSIEVHEAARDSEKLAIPGPTPLPEERHPAAFAEPHVQLFEEFVRWRKSHLQRQWRVAPSLRGKQVSLGASHSLAPGG